MLESALPCFIFSGAKASWPKGLPVEEITWNVDRIEPLGLRNNQRQPQPMWDMSICGKSKGNIEAVHLSPQLKC